MDHGPDDQDCCEAEPGRLARSVPGCRNVEPVRPYRTVYVRWRRESGDWVGETSHDPAHFRIEQRIHGKYLVNADHREQIRVIRDAKREAEARARAAGCTPFTIKAPAKRTRR